MRTGTSTDNWSAVEPEPKRRRRSKLERLQIVEETLQPGASVAVIARAHGVNANQVFHWRKLYREGGLDVKSRAAELMPVRITEENEERRIAPLCLGTIQIELGRARVRIEGAVDADALRMVLEQLGR